MRLLYVFFLSAQEAQNLLALVEDHALPDPLPHGSFFRLGRDLWRMLQRYGLILSVGRGKGTVVMPDRLRFQQTRFQIVPRRGRREMRWEILPESQQELRSPDAWVQELRQQLLTDLPKTETTLDLQMLLAGLLAQESAVRHTTERLRTDTKTAPTQVTRVTKALEAIQEAIASLERARKLLRSTTSLTVPQ